jgi:sulfur relay (sulfurtransferase) DsrC/TusE family protein
MAWILLYFLYNELQLAKHVKGLEESTYMYTIRTYKHHVVANSVASEAETESRRIQWRVVYFRREVKAVYNRQPIYKLSDGDCK